MTGKLSGGSFLRPRASFLLLVLMRIKKSKLPPTRRKGGGGKAGRMEVEPDAIFTSDVSQTRKVIELGHTYIQKLKSTRALAREGTRRSSLIPTPYSFPPC